MFWHQQLYPGYVIAPACGHSGYTVTCKVWHQHVDTQDTRSPVCFCTCVWIPRIHCHLYVIAPASGHPRNTVLCMLLYQKVDTQDTQSTTCSGISKWIPGIQSAVCSLIARINFHMYVLHQQVDTQDTLSYECYCTSKLISKIHFHMHYCTSNLMPRVLSCIYSQT